MSRRDGFLSGFSPLPEGIALPSRVGSGYEAESCLSSPESGHLVLRMRRKSDGSLVVLKAVREDKEDLAEEFQLLRQLAPLLPGQVPEPIDSFEEDGTGYLLRGYLSGETLAQRREREGACPEVLCVSLGRELCALLGVLHGQQPPVIHRDIKPENIILLPDGGVGLIDFGIARQFKKGRDTDTRHMGTRATAAPEQYGYAQTDPRTDLYALGVTLTWLLTGEYDRGCLARQKGVSPALRRTLEKAAAFSPESRFQNAAAFSAALAGQRPRRRWPVLAAVLLALAVGLGFGLPQIQREPEPPLPEITRQTAPPSAQPPATNPPATPAPATPEPEPVRFASTAMEAAVRQALDKPEGAITYEDLGGIERLAVVGETPFGPEQSFDYRISCYVDGQIQNDFPKGDIGDEDLALLAHMPNLTELYLCRQGIRDIASLAGLPLTTLALCEDDILDLSPLATLTELDTLYLAGNPATDYSPLASLARLKTLIVEGSGTAGGICAADSLAFLDGLTLRKMGLGLTVPKDGDWSPVTRQIALEELWLWDPSPEAVAAVNTLTGLKSLSIGDYFASDLTSLSGLTSLEVLNIHKNSLESLEGIQPLTRLLTLSVGYCPVTDLSPLAGLPRLNYLQLEDLAIDDFSALSTLPALECVVVPASQAPLVEDACPGHAFELRPY